MVEHDTRLKKIGRRTALAAGGVLAVGGLSGVGYLAYEHGDELGEVSSSIVGFITEDKCKMDDLEKDYERVRFPKDLVSSVPDLKEYASEVALEYDLTLVRSQPFLQAVDQADSKEEVMEVLNHYGGNFPFSIEIPTEKELSDFPFDYKPLDTESLSLEEYQQFANDFLDDMHYIPREVVQLSGFEKIKLVKELELEDYVPNLFINNSEFFSSVYYPINNTIYVSYKNGNPEKVSDRFLSSFSTAIDLEVCGNFGAQRDEVFADLNPEDFLYGNIDEEFPKISAEISGQLDIIRDKKNTMKAHIFPHSSPEFMQESEVIQNKASLIASRINNSVPHFYDYWSSFLNVKDAS